MAKKIKVAVIGVGNIAKHHIQAYIDNPYTELYAFCDINPKRLKEMGETYGVERLYTDLDEMLALKEIEAVSVCTWNSAHAPCSIAAMKAGKHVLCEKPMALNAKQAREMKKVADETGKLLMIGFVCRFGDDCELVETFSKDLGEIYYAKSSYLRRDGNPGGWFGDKERSGGGPLIDLGVHHIDLVRYLAGKPKPVSVYGATFQKLFNRKGAIGAPKYLSSSATNNDICNVEDLATALIRFDNGLVLSADVSFSLNIKEDNESIQLFGTKGGVNLYPQVEMYTEAHHYLTNVGFAKQTALDFGDFFRHEVNHYVDCLRGKAKECKAPAEDGIVLMEILDAIYESAATGHEVRMK